MSVPRRRRALPVALLAAAALWSAACGGGSDAAGPTSSVSASPSTTGSTSSAPTTTGGGSDDCLPGTWTMKQDTLDLLAASAVPIAGIKITKGGWTLDLSDDGAASSEARFTAAFAPDPSVSAEADVVWKHTGTWTASGSELELKMSQTEAGVTQIRQAGISAPGGPLPPVNGLQGGPYECGPNRLTVTTTNGIQPLEMVFER